MSNRAMDEVIIRFMDKTHVALSGLLEYVQRLEARVRAIEATNRSPKGTKDGDTGTRGNK